MFKVIAGSAVSLLVSSCGSDFIHDERLAGPYRLVAVDTMEQMSLCRDIDPSGSCAGDGLAGETLFAAGANNRFIALAIHPNGDRTRTDFYYLVRSAREADDGGRGAVLKGPLDERSFAEAKARLDLPRFSRVFSNLK
ncbi:hypothetical protein G7077_02745 [Sphingomonas piscis]|uniref:Lipoprotein n=1 Tax=Sphingomonas piscis TaxID=2714943 RepID=A0A6G7YML9_9SPHN|nr:hypothetical protein [Sphingomonas piscis]QIK77988.1 hypothetical protein G7077_02745 [Sphingomonas piscis]